MKQLFHLYNLLGARAFAFLLFLIALLWPARAEWQTRRLNFGQIDRLDTALVSIGYAVDGQGRLVEAYGAANWLWQVETNGEVCALTGKRYYRFKNVNTGLYYDGTSLPVRDASKAWLFSFVSLLDTVYADARYRGTEGIDYDCIDDTTAYWYNHFLTFRDTTRGPIPALAIHFEFDGDSTYRYFLDDVSLAYDDGEDRALDRLLAYKDSLARIDWAPEQAYVVGSGPGRIDRALLDSVRARYNEMLDASLTDGLQAAAYDSARLRLVAALRAADSVAALVPGGYYRLTSLFHWQPLVLRSDGGGGLYATAVEALHADEVFHIVRQAQGTYTVRCVADSLYLGPAEMGPAGTSATLAAPYYFDHAGSDSLALYSLDARGNRQGLIVMGETKQMDGRRTFAVMTYNNGGAWRLTALSNAQADSTGRAVAQAWRDRHLAALIDTAQAAVAPARVAYQLERSEVAEAVQRLRAAIDVACTVPAGSTTMAQLQALKAPYDAFLAVWADSTALCALMEHAGRLATARQYIGDDVGKFPEYAADELAEAVAEAEALRPFARLDKVQTDAAAATLQAAIDAFQAQVVLPQEDQAYFIYNNWQSPQWNEQMRATYRKCLYADGYDAHATVKWGGGMDEQEQNGLAAWRFVDLGGGCFALRNLASAWYLGPTVDGRLSMSDTAVAYRFVALGDGLLALQSEGSRLLLTPHLQDRLATGEAATADYRQAWAINEVDAERMTDVKHFKPTAAHLVTLPYATTQLPVSTVARLQWFSIKGARRDAEGRVEALALKLVDTETLQPLQPYVLVVGRSLDGEADVPVDMCLDLYSWLDTAATTQWGAVGTLRDVSLRRDGLAVGGRSYSLQPTDAAVTTYVPTQQGYVRLGAVPDVAATATVDAWLPVARARFAPRDHNRDGRVGLPDAVLLIDRIARGWQTDADLYDHNRDGRVDQPDATVIIEQTVGQ